MHTLQVTTFLYRVRTNEDAKWLKSVMLRETSPEAAYAEFQKQAPILSDDEEAPDADGSENNAKAATPASGSASAPETTSVAAAPAQPKSTDESPDADGSENNAKAATPASKSTDETPAGTNDEKLLLKMFVSLVEHTPCKCCKKNTFVCLNLHFFTFEIWNATYSPTQVLQNAQIR